MPLELTNRATGLPELVEDGDVAAKLASGKYEQPDAVAVHRLGEDTYAAPDVAVDEQAYAPTIDPTISALASGHAIREARNTGVLAGVKSVVGGGLSGLSLGLVNPYEEEQEFHPTLSGLGQLGGSLALGELAGVGELGTSIAGKAGGGVVGSTLGGAAEGGAYGLGQGVSELNRSDDPITAERAASVLSSNLLFGAGIGGGFGGAGKLLESGLGKARSALDSFAAARDASAGIAPDLAQLDEKGLRDLKDAEIEKLASEQATRRATAPADLTAYRAAVKEANPWLVVDEGEPAAMLNDTNKQLRKAMNDPEGLGKNPATLLKPLRIQQQAFERALEDQAGIATKFAAANDKLATGLGEELATLPDSATSVEMTGKLARRYGAYADVKVGKGVAASVSVARDDASAFLDALKDGSVHGEGQAAFGKLQGLVDANKALQAKIEANLLPESKLLSPRLSSINDALGVLTTGSKESTAQKLLGGAVYSGVAGVAHALPIPGSSLAAPMIASKAADMMKSLVFGRMGKAVGEAAQKSSGAVAKFLDVASKLPPIPTVLATKVLGSVRYAPAQTLARGQDEPQPSKKLHELYSARSAEIRSQTAINPQTGLAEMRPEARAAMAAQISPIRSQAPLLADQIETVAARRMEYLASALPKKPDMGGMVTGPDTWHPSDMEMRSFARKVAAVEDPAGVEERLAQGTITPEDVEAYRAVYPERAAALTQQIIESLPTLKKPLPYARRLALSMFTGQPVDPSMDPKIFSVLQRGFSADPTTNGGTNAPKPQPQFGSVKKSLPEPTPAQQRGG